MEEKNLHIIKKALESGELIIYPTDTVYGIAGSIYNEESLKNIYLAKKREFSSPLIILISSIKKLDEIAIIPDENRKKIENLISNFWPGGLTLILKKQEWIPNIMTNNKDTIGIRMPKLDIALQIIEMAGGILPTTSANISGEKTPNSFLELSEEIKNKVAFAIDGGTTPLKKESTIIDMTSTPKILRNGAISIEAIEKIIGKL